MKYIKQLEADVTNLMNKIDKEYKIFKEDEDGNKKCEIPKFFINFQKVKHTGYFSNEIVYNIIGDDNLLILGFNNSEFNVAFEVKQYEDGFGFKFFKPDNLYVLFKVYIKTIKLKNLFSKYHYDIIMVR